MINMLLEDLIKFQWLLNKLVVNGHMIRF